SIRPAWLELLGGAMAQMMLDIDDLPTIRQPEEIGHRRARIFAGDEGGLERRLARRGRPAGGPDGDEVLADGVVGAAGGSDDVTRGRQGAALGAENLSRQRAGEEVVAV